MIFEGVVIDDSTYLPIPYVNLALPNSDLGTVSNAEGRFRFIIPKNQKYSNIILSHIAYNPIVTSIQDIDKFNKIDSFFLHKRTYKLEEVVIDNSNLKVLELGDFTEKRNFHIGFRTDDNLGQELLKFIKVKKKDAFKLELAKIVLQNPCKQKIRIRINIYDKDKHTLLRDDIILTTALSNNRLLLADLSNNNIIIKNDFFVGIEMIESYPREELLFTCGRFSHNKIYTRKSKQGNWHIIDGMSLAISVSGKTIK